jgi:hypothetical protein
MRKFKANTLIAMGYLKKAEAAAATLISSRALAE